MTTPTVWQPPVLMVALARLSHSTQSGRLPDILPGQSFWASGKDAPNLLAGGLARSWMTGDPAAPAPNPPRSVRGQMALGNGTSNSSG